MDTKQVACWLPTEVCTPPREVIHPEFASLLADEFAENGWDTTKGALVGYKNTIGSVQLLSGENRWAAADVAGIQIPVVLYTYGEVYRAWGDPDLWKRILDSGKDCDW